MLRALLLAVAVAAAAAISAVPWSTTATAATTAKVSEDAIPSPGALVLRGTHGFRIFIDTVKRGRGRQDEVTVTASQRRSEVAYVAPANLAGEGIHANLGRFGRIDLRWVPDGRVGEIHLSCHGHGPRSQYFFDRGAYVGRVSFRGGNGFTAVRARRVEWQASWYRNSDSCRREAGESIPGPGKILEAETGGRSPRTKFYVYQPKPGARVAYEAYDRESVEGIGVYRVIAAYGRPRTLDSASDFSTATVEPPAPFSGTAIFQRTEHAKGTWLGDLTVDFPDISGVPLAGEAFEAEFHSGSLEGLSR